MEAPSARSRLRLLGLPIDNLSMDEAVAAVLRLAQGDRPRQVCFVNADCVNIAARDPAYRAVLADASLVLADGAGVRIAGKALGAPIRDNVNGTDLFPRLLAALEGSGLGLFLVGARPGVVDDLAAWIRAEHPGVSLSGWQHGYLEPHEIAPCCAVSAATGETPREGHHPVHEPRRRARPAGRPAPHGDVPAGGPPHAPARDRGPGRAGRAGARSGAGRPTRDRRGPGR
jgi:hypothetical protein